MSEKRRQTKAQREIEETIMLVDYLVEFDLDFEDASNFTEKTVKQAKEWWNDRECYGD